MAQRNGLILSASKLIGFAATARPEESKRFYEEVLGLSLIEDAPRAMVFDANGTTLRIQKMKSVTPPAYTVLGWEVPDIRSVVRRLSDEGVSFALDYGSTQDGLGTVAWFKDPDENTLYVAQTSAR